MKIIRTNTELNFQLNELRQQGKTIGFVPTMGALHAGHLSLIDESKKQTDYTVCSIFVNPTQFNDKADLEKYPRTEAEDCKLLETAGCDFVFMPTVEEIYPPDLQTPDFDFGNFATVMEGKMRPGHFKGMAQVVHRLLLLVQPNSLFMGQKDLQQFTIVQRMLELMNSKINLVCCPIIREADGLAMSSRNVRLTDEERTTAPIIFETLKILLEKDFETNFTMPQNYCNWAVEKLNQQAGITSEYVEVVNLKSLQKISNWNDANQRACCVALRLGNVRLIDNVIFQPLIS